MISLEDRIYLSQKKWLFLAGTKRAKEENPVHEFEWCVFAKLKGLSHDIIAADMGRTYRHRGKLCYWTEKEKVKKNRNWECTILTTLLSKTLERNARTTIFIPFLMLIVVRSTAKINPLFAVLCPRVWLNRSEMANFSATIFADGFCWGCRVVVDGEIYWTIGGDWRSITSKEVAQTCADVFGQALAIGEQMLLLKRGLCVDGIIIIDGASLLLYFRCHL